MVKNEYDVYAMTDKPIGEIKFPKQLNVKYYAANFSSFNATFGQVIGDINPDMMILDYFWLQPGHISDQSNGSNTMYGPHWFLKSGQINQSFETCASLKFFLFPVDKSGIVINLWKKSYVKDNLASVLLRRDDVLRFNPLVYCDMESDALLGEIVNKGTCFYNFNKYLNEETPYILVARSKVDVLSFVHKTANTNKSKIKSKIVKIAKQPGAPLDFQCLNKVPSYCIVQNVFDNKTIEILLNGGNFSDSGNTTESWGGAIDYFKNFKGNRDGGNRLQCDVPTNMHVHLESLLINIQEKLNILMQPQATLKYTLHKFYYVPAGETTSQAS